MGEGGLNMNQVWVVLFLLTLVYAGCLQILYRHFTNIYEAQMNVTDKLIQKVTQLEKIYMGEEE